MSSWSRALDQLVRERGPALFGYAYVLTGNSADAEDLVQTALVRTFRTAKASRGIDSTHAYVKKAITTAFIDSGRRANARPQRAPGDAGDPAFMASAPHPDHADTVVTSVDFHGAILGLPPRERACVVLRYLEDKPVSAISAELGIATGTVKRYLSDAVATLRGTMGDLELADPESETRSYVPVTSPKAGRS
jgi:RNA polymerase sigma factor (sigma-70 family)